MQKEYFQNLDILRFLAFFSVFVSHIFLTIFIGIDSDQFDNIKNLFLVHGDKGVNFFFTLSGFLITYLLIKEKKTYGNINIKKFFIRRTLRIWPVYFLTISISFFIIPLVFVILKLFLPDLTSNALDGTSLAQLPWFLFFLANFGLGQGPGNLASGVLWSISVEEQFYLLWPWIISLIPTKYLPRVFGAFVILSTIHRFYYSPDFSIIKYSTFSVISDFICGAWFAYAVLSSPRIKDLFKNSSKNWLYIPTILVVVLLPISTLATKLTYNHLLLFKISSAIIPLVFSLLFAFIICKVSFNNYKDDVKSKTKKVLIYLGTISYGLYCYHGISILSAKIIGISPFSHSFGQVSVFIIEAFVAALLTVALAMISFHFMEKPILAFKKRFET